MDDGEATRFHVIVSTVTITPPRDSPAGHNTPCIIHNIILIRIIHNTSDFPVYSSTLERAFALRVAIDELGAPAALQPTLQAWSGRLDGVYLHFDLDVHDPSTAPINSYQAPGGLSEGQVRDCLGAIADAAPIIGCTFSAYDPGCDPEGKGLATALELMQALATRIGSA